ncbi:inactive protein RESTRICTED TEV MOVEMENT 1-like isoform X2 [Populus nigra]|uniref:inactive protein RESTRICTED TEV MOVEMENT 1-like isoform X2 n=1 Tax=Populus nigra TaxID=3691 RepID=UPI002B26E2FC|nr:inactive protein RESTRICTED TEV MOVEMENT 1-like isoform X2 [Populus nigra]
MIKLEAGTKRLVPIWGHSEISALEFDWDHKGSTEISHIYISHDNHIRFIQFQYVEENGVLSKLSPMPVKNPYGWRFNVVKLDYPREFLKGISGDWSNGNVNSLTFTTNRGTYGPFGCKAENGTEFDFQTGDEPLFAGLHGSFDDDGLRTIGIYVNPEQASL